MGYSPGSPVPGFSRQEHWSGLPFPPPGDLPNPGIKLTFLMSPALGGEFFTTNATWEAQISFGKPEELSTLLDKAKNYF